MDLRDTPEEAAFRAELRSWLEENLPDDLQGHRGGATRFDGPEMRAWSRALYDAGYVGLTWPEEYGGGGAPYTHQAIFLEELARAEAPPHIGVIGIGMAGPTIIAHGTDEQKGRYLAPLLAAEEIWCQGFSEPGAGLRSRRRADELDARRRPLRRERAEGVVVVRPPRRLLHPAHALRPGVDAPRGAHVPHRRHARPRRGGPPAQADHGRGGVQRDLLLGRARPRGEPARGGRRRLAGRDDDAAPRARHARLRAAGGTRGADQQARLARAGPRGRPAAARPDRARVDRDAGRAIHELPLALRADEDRDARPRRVDLEARLVGGEPARDEARAGDPRPGRGTRRGQRAVRRLLAVPAAQKPRKHDRGGHVGGAPQHRRRARARPPVFR